MTRWIRSRAPVQLVEQMRDVSFHCGLGDVKARRDLRIAQPKRNLAQHIALAISQPFQLFRLPRLRLGALGELLDQALGDRRREQRVARGDNADCLDEVLGRRGLEQERGRTGGEGVKHVLVQLECGEDDDPRAARDLASGFDAVETRHADVHQDDIGPFLADEVDRLLAVAGLAGDPHVGLRLHDHAKARAHQGLVVGDDDSDQLLIGNFARTVNPPSDEDPEAISPPKSSTRSRIPIRPWPVDSVVFAPVPLSLIVSISASGR